jgi:hypothetical protein
MLILHAMCQLSALCQQCPTPISRSKDSEAPRSLETSVPWKKECKTFKLFLVVYTLDVDTAEFCTMAASALSFGFELNVVGLDNAAKNREAGSVQMIWALHDFVKSLPDESTTTVLFLGSSHALFVGSPESLLVGFLESGKDVLFSAAKDCCHDWWQSVELLGQKKPMRCNDRYAFVLAIYVRA